LLHPDRQRADHRAGPADTPARSGLFQPAEAASTRLAVQALRIIAAAIARQPNPRRTPGPQRPPWPRTRDRGSADRPNMRGSSPDRHRGATGAERRISPPWGPLLSRGRGDLTRWPGVAGRGWGGAWCCGFPRGCRLCRRAVGVQLERPEPRSGEDERAGCRQAAADHRERGRACCGG